MKIIDGKLYETVSDKDYPLIAYLPGHDGNQGQAWGK